MVTKKLTKKGNTFKKHTRKRSTRKRSNKKRVIRKSSSKTLKKQKKTYNLNDFNSNDGMLTSVWGPGLWHYLHTMSFNYPSKPTSSDKKHYKMFIENLQNVLPCSYCRKNLIKNLQKLPLTSNRLKNRYEFSKYIYDLHELVNKMLGKSSGLKYCDVRERYEHFRSRCTLDAVIKHKFIKKTTRKSRKQCKPHKEKGCTEPLYGKKSKCIIKIVPQEEKGDTFQIDKKCIKTRKPSE